MEIVAGAISLGYIQSCLDPTLFILRGHNEVSGLVIVEVDDVWTAGSDMHYQKMGELRERFTFGKFKWIQDFKMRGKV